VFDADLVGVASGLVIVTGVMVVVRWIDGLSSTSLFEPNNLLWKLGVVFGNFWPNLSLAVVPFGVVLLELFNNTVVFLGLVDFSAVSIGVDVDEVIFVF
jgi:hypothetical protein